MKQFIYSLLDVKSREFGTLVLATNDHHVIRSLKTGIPGSGSLMEKYPEDFHVMVLGIFDTETGQIVAREIPQLVTTVREALEVNDGR